MASQCLAKLEIKKSSQVFPKRGRNPCPIFITVASPGLQQQKTRTKSQLAAEPRHPMENTGILVSRPKTHSNPFYAVVVVVVKY